MMQDYQEELIKIKNLLRQIPNGMSVTEISKALNKSKTTIGRYLDVLLISGQVDMRTYGMAKVYTLSERVPMSAMLSCSNDLVIVLDEDARIIEINDNFLNLLKKIRGDVIGKNLAFLNPEDVEIDELLEILPFTTEKKERTITFRSKEKGDLFFQLKSMPVVFETGDKGLTIILEDVTDQIISEREIRESEERFHLMAENIQDGLIIVENGKIAYANNRLAEITGYSLDELWQKNPLSIIDQEDKQKMKKMLKSMEASSPEPVVIQPWIIRKDGQRRFVYVRSTVFHNGKNTYVFIILTDITELKSTEVALREAEQRFRMMAENIQEGLIIIEGGKIVFSNRRISEITGYSDEELLNLGFIDLISLEKFDEVNLSGIISRSEVEKIDKLIRVTKPGSSVPAEFEVWIQRKDGVRRLIHGKITAAEHDGTISTYITATDTTEYAEKEKVLRDRIASLQDLIS